MAVADSLQSRAKANPGRVTAVLSLVGYVLVGLAFTPAAPFPSVGDDTVILLGDAIAVVNTLALTALLTGVYFIRRGAVRKHRAAMLTAFTLILVFLVLYLTKVGGGFERSLVVRESHFLGVYAGVVRPAYLAMLAVHIFLSVVSVPVVLYAIVLGSTHTPAELRGTVHARVGRVAVLAWSLSLVLGVVTYLLLNHVYAWEPRHAAFVLLVVGPPVEGLRASVE
jgi:putative membrane protein